MKVTNKKISALAILLWVLVLSGASEAQAASFTVNQAGDAGDLTCDATCTLRDAIDDANNAATNDVINFAAGLTNITLNNEIGIVNNGSLTINGLGANVQTIDGGAGTNRIFSIDFVANVTITDVTLTGGNGISSFANGEGGAIAAVEATLTLDRVHVTGNSANSAGGGIAVFYAASFQFPRLRINNSTFSNNRAGNVAGGGGAGGSVSVNRGFLDIENSTFSGNTANSSGGGILGVNGSQMTLRSVTVTGNTALGIGSTAAAGGGIAFDGTLNFGNSIVAGNTVSGTGASAPEISNNGTTTSAGFNLVGDSTDDAGNTGNPITYQSTDILDTDPQLGALANNGGTTPTHALQALPVLSPAIDKGNSFGLTTDQRGLARPFDFISIGNAAGGNGSDIGAFELQASPTAASVSISGRLVTADGRGINNARVRLTEADGNVRTVFTGAFGYYRFSDVAAGQTVILEVFSKRFDFKNSARAINLTEDIKGADFMALP